MTTIELRRVRGPSDLKLELNLQSSPNPCQKIVA